MGCSASRPVVSSTTYVPMWILSVDDFLKLDYMPQHEELIRRGVLVKRQDSHFIIFVSHQWLGSSHPDPKSQQLPVLQEALRNILSGKSTAQSDLASQFFGESRRLTKDELHKLKTGYIWLDWFSIPQEVAEVSFEVEDKEDEAGEEDDFEIFSHRIGSLPSLRSPSSLTNQDLYICSIPFFVEVSDIFLALVPPLHHSDTEQKCNFRSYLTRGWCRMEMWCSILCVKVDQPFLVVKGTDEVEFATPLILTDRPPHEGNFTVESDRKTIYHVMRRALQNRIGALQQSRQWDMYRFTVARCETLLGDPPVPRELTKFLADFAFESLEKAKDIKGIGPVECAVLSNDVGMIAFLASMGFDMSRNVNAKINVEILQNGRCTLDFALELCWRNQEVILQLLRFKANVNHEDAFGFAPLGACKTPEDIDLLIRHRAEVNKSAGPLHVTPLCLCCVRCAPASVVAKLIEYRAEVDPPCRGVLSPHPLANLGVWACSNPYCLETAQLLLDAKSDINLQYEAKGVFKTIEMINRTRLRLFGSDSALVQFFAEWTTTPLGFACFYGCDEFVEFLLRHDADPNKTNARGKRPLQLAKGQSVLKIIEDFKSIQSI